MADTPPTPPAFDPSQYPDAEKSFPGAAAAINAIGGHEKFTTLSALQIEGRGWDNFDQNNRYKPGSDALKSAGNAVLYNSLFADVKDLAKKWDTLSPDDQTKMTNALKTLGGQRAVDIVGRMAANKDYKNSDPRVQQMWENDVGKEFSAFQNSVSDTLKASFKSKFPQVSMVIPGQDFQVAEASESFPSPSSPIKAQPQISGGKPTSIRNA